MSHDSNYAPAERYNLEKLKISYREIKALPFVSEILRKLPFVLGVLNDYRQFVFYNTEYFAAMGQDPDALELGLRPGELFGCVHSNEPGGCGTSRSCRYCGAVNVFLEAQKLKKKVTDEARLTLKKGDSFTAMDLEVTVSPFVYDQHHYYVLSMVDISQKKMHHYLERAFFHDSINVISGLQGVLQLLSQASEHKNQDLLDTSLSATSHLLDIFDQYKTMFKAENDEIELKPTIFDPGCFMKSLENRARGIDWDKKIGFELILNPADELIRVDRTLLDRVLFNMLKNAIEASKENSTIIFSFEKKDKIIFKVHNPGYIPQDVQSQIFQRSFSTKGKGRGVGTYSMKLLTEKYLKGQVYFETDLQKGTTFFCELPVLVDNL